ISAKVEHIVRYVALVCCALFLLVMSACARDKSAEGPPQPATSTALVPTAFDQTAAPEPNPPSINADRTMQYIKEIVAFGPRPIGSANHKKLENYIYSHLKGDQVEDDAFTADTPEGKFPVRNIIAKFPGTRDGVAVVAGHYDTNYPRSEEHTSELQSLA